MTVIGNIINGWHVLDEVQQPDYTLWFILVALIIILVVLFGMLIWYNTHKK